MNQIIFKSGMNRLCLISFILLCCVFTSENAFSVPSWDWNYLRMGYNKEDKSINFVFILNAYCHSRNKYGFLKTCDIAYSTNFMEYTHLMGAEILNHKKGTALAWILLRDKKEGEIIQFNSANKRENGKIWPENEKCYIKVESTDFKFVEHQFIYNCCFLSIRWDVSKSRASVKCIKFTGVWICENGGREQIITEYYPVVDLKSNSNRLENEYSVLNSAISNNVKVSKEKDAIIVKGADPGEKIKVYTAAGAELKSVIATDGVVNIKLAKNHIYIVKAGEARYKVAL